MNTQPTAAGWHQDPDDSSRQRFFDGDNWTDNTKTPSVAGSVMAAPSTSALAEPKLSPVDYWKKVVFRNYINFKGRARRAEYWWFWIINFVFVNGLFVLALILSSVNETLGVIGFVVYGLFALAMLLPSFAVSVRRLHDTEKSAAYLLFALIPIIGAIIVMVALASSGTPSANQYGPRTK